jgi:hypothetical protein
MVVMAAMVDMAAVMVDAATEDMATRIEWFEE